MKSTLHKHKHLKCGLYFNVFAMLSLVWTLTSCEHKTEDLIIPRVTNGIMDLRSWDFSRDGTIKLNGQWAFYWQQLIDPNQISSFRRIERFFSHQEMLADSDRPNQNYENLFVEVPHTWTKTKIKNIHLDSDGFATYHLQLLVDSNLSMLALRLLEMGNAYTLFINGEEIARNGKVATSKEIMIPQWLPKSVAFPIENSRLDLVLHVSSFHHRDAGFWLPIELGAVDQIFRKRDRNVALELFVVGILSIIGFYQFGLYLIRPKDSSPLLFALFALLIAARVFVTGEKYLIDLFPFIPWWVFVKIEYFSFYMAAPVFAMFIHSLFPQEFDKRILQIFIVFGIIFGSIILLTPANIYSHTLNVYQIGVLILGLYGTFVIFRAVSRQREGAGLFAFAWIIFFITVINDILYNSKIIASTPMLPIGLFVFIFSQALLLSIRFAKAFSQTEDITFQLEAEVKKRISEVEKMKQLTATLSQSTANRLENSPMEELNRFFLSIHDSNSLDDMMDKIFVFVKKNFSVQGAWLWLFDAQKREFYTYKYSVSHSYAPETHKLLRNIRLPLNESSGTTWHVCQKKRPVFLKRIYPNIKRIEKIIVDTLGIRSSLQIPLIIDDDVIGFLNFTSFSYPLKLNRSDIKLLDDIGRHLANSMIESNNPKQLKQPKAKK